MRLLFLGPPGAGKGTQAKRLAEYFQVPHISTGDMFRQAAEEGTALGIQVEEIMASGDLVPDDLTNQIVAERIAKQDAQKGFVLDGYPRNLEQAEVLDRALDEAGAKIDAVVKFMLTGKEIISRLTQRRVCQRCGRVYHLQANPPVRDSVCDDDGTALTQRPDDMPKAIEQRLEIYGKQTKPLFDLYEARELLREVDAIGSQDEVFDRVLSAIGSPA